MSAAFWGFEGAHALEGELANLDRLEAAGFRVVGLLHFFDNEVGGSLHGVDRGGLTELGRALVAEVEARGMILDVAHSSEAVVREVLDMTDMPIVLSHGGIASHCDSPRNISDALMRQIAEEGGLLGVGYWAGAVCDPSPASVRRRNRCCGRGHGDRARLAWLRLRRHGAGCL